MSGMYQHNTEPDSERNVTYPTPRTYPQLLWYLTKGVVTGINEEKVEKQKADGKAVKPPFPKSNTGT